MTNIDNTEIERLVREAMEGIRKGLPEGDRLIMPVEFDLAVVKTQEAGGVVKLIVASINGSYKKENISRIKFAIQPHRKIFATTIKSIN